MPRHTSATSTGSCRNCRGAVGTATPRPDAGAMASRWGAPASSPALRFPGRSRTPGGRSRPPPTPPHTRGDAGESPGCTRRGAGRTHRRGAGIVVAGSGRNKGSLKKGGFHGRRTMACGGVAGLGRDHDRAVPLHGGERRHPRPALEEWRTTTGTCGTRSATCAATSARCSARSSSAPSRMTGTSSGSCTKRGGAGETAGLARRGRLVARPGTKTLSPAARSPGPSPVHRNGHGPASPRPTPPTERPCGASTQSRPCTRPSSTPTSTGRRRSSKPCSGRRCPATRPCTSSGTSGA